MTATGHPAPRAGQIGARSSGRRATRTTVAAFGAVAGLAGVEHGVGEILQGAQRPAGLVIASWPDSESFAVVGGEPGFTVVPSLAVAGVLTIVVAVAVMVWAIGFVGRRHGGWVLIALSLLLFVVGGGFGPPLIGVILGLAVVAPPRTPGPVGRRIAPAWRWLVGAGVAAFLAMVPGLVVLSELVEVAPAVTAVLGLTAFGCLLLSLVAARARDA